MRTHCHHLPESPMSKVKAIPDGMHSLTPTTTSGG